MSTEPVIIFGPTGQVGSQVAHHVARAGAKIVLAMRDTSKPIPMLGASEYTRITADLTDPASVAAAVKETGAKAAFIYVPPGTQDGMRGTIEAMKDAGIEFVVFLSSYSINVQTTYIGNIKPDKWIPYIHASVELVLQFVFKDSHVAIRAGRFATNTLVWGPGIRAGTVKVYKPDFRFDYVTAGDLGLVSASVLTSTNKRSFPQVFLVMGPQVITQREAIATIGRAVGKEIEVEELTLEVAMRFAMAGGMSQPIADYIFGEFNDKGNGAYAEPYAEEGSANVQHYAGQKAESFDVWVQHNKAVFLDSE